MRGRKSALVVLLSEDELHQLRTCSRWTTTAVGLVRRANAILGLHQGLTIKEAAQRAPLSETHARKWITRFLQQRLQGLHDSARPGRRTQVEHEYQRCSALNLLAALDTRRGKVWGEIANRKRQIEFLALLETVKV